MSEIKELSDWIKNDRHLQNWWEEEFAKSDAGINPVLRDKLFARIKEQTQGKEETQGKEKPRTIRMNLLEMGCRHRYYPFVLPSSPTIL